MDIFDADYKDHSEEGVDFQIVDPVTKEAFTNEKGEVFTMTLRALSSAPVKAADKAFRKLHPSKAWTKEEQEAYQVAVVSAALAGWRGTRMEYKAENVKKLLTGQAWIAEKAFLFILDADRFLSA